MARQHTSSKSFKSIALGVIVWLGLVILLGKLDGPAEQLSNLLGGAARETLERLPTFVPAVWQALHAYAFDHQPFSPCALRMLVSCWPLLCVMAGAI
jgi:hypothetical protein